MRERELAMRGTTSPTREGLVNVAVPVGGGRRTEISPGCWAWVPLSDNPPESTPNLLMQSGQFTSTLKTSQSFADEWDGFNDDRYDTDGDAAESIEMTEQQRAEVIQWCEELGEPGKAEFLRQQWLAKPEHIYEKVSRIAFEINGLTPEESRILKEYLEDWL